MVNPWEVLANAKLNKKQEVLNKIEECFLLAENFYGKQFQRLESVDYQNCKQSAGYARWINGKFYIELNENMLYENPEFINITVPHEMAHIIDYQMRKKSNHDTTWAICCKVLKCKEVNTYHNYDTNSSLEYSNKVQVVCKSCKTKLVLSPTKISRAKSGKVKYFCGACHTELKIG